MNQSSDIRKSWEANAAAWIATIENNELESRQLATNAAIVDAVLKCKPNKVLDLGCGEGWLSRQLRKNGLEVWGTDAVPSLVEAAIAKDGNFYVPLSYEEIVAGQHNLPAPFDLAVFNFALLDKEAAEALIHYLPRLLRKQGYLVIQTLHSHAISSVEEYKSGWKEGSWNGLKRDFVLPYQWYFRTLEDWVILFNAAGFSIQAIKEPVHPATGKPLSHIFVLIVNKINAES